MVRPASLRARMRRFPGVIKREVKLAERMRRPGRCGASERTTVSTSGSSGNVNENLAVFHFYGEFRQLQVFIEVVRARTAVVFPAMPGAHQHVAVQRSLPERPSGVQADSLQGMQLSAHITDS